MYNLADPQLSGETWVNSSAFTTELCLRGWKKLEFDTEVLYCSKVSSLSLWVFLNLLFICIHTCYMLYDILKYRQSLQKVPWMVMKSLLNPLGDFYVINVHSQLKSLTRNSNSNKILLSQLSEVTQLWFSDMSPSYYNHLWAVVLVFFMLLDHT